MGINIGDKIASDDHCAVGVLTEIDGKLMVVGDFGGVEYDCHTSDWEHFHLWKKRIDAERRSKGGFLKRLVNAL